jgi:hypothetical protein
MKANYAAAQNVLETFALPLGAGSLSSSCRTPLLISPAEREPEKERESTWTVSKSIAPVSALHFDSESHLHTSSAQELLHRPLLVWNSKYENMSGALIL